MLAAIENFNKVYGDYKLETTLILLTNAWELIAKAVLVKRKKNIYQDRKKTKTLSCEEAINKLLYWKELEENQVELLQQIASLRNRCTHGVLPNVPEEIQHHLLFFGCKFFKDLAITHFPKNGKLLNKNFLTLSLDHMTTYGDKIQKLVSRLRRGKKGDKELVWLLERGIRYVENNSFISQEEFEKLYKGKKKITPYLKIGEYIQNADMVRVVPIQAPKNYSVDIELRKGSKKLEKSLPVSIKRSDIDSDYPHLTKDIATELNRSVNFVAKCMTGLGLKGDRKYHQAIRTSDSGVVQRYSNSAKDYLKEYLKNNPQYDPFRI